MAADSSLRDRALSGLRWSFVNQAARQALAFVSAVILLDEMPDYLNLAARIVVGGGTYGLTALRFNIGSFRQNMRLILEWVRPEGSRDTP